MHTYCRQLQQLEEQKQQLEHYNATIQEEKDSLLQQNTSLTERLEAVVTEKRPCHQFDGQTPIDKTLDLLQNLILVGSQLKALAVHSSLSMTCQLTHLLHAYNYTRACVCVCVCVCARARAHICVCLCVACTKVVAALGTQLQQQSEDGIL